MNSLAYKIDILVIGGGQAGLNAFGADYGTRPRFWKE